jgi:hypothetical protein
MSEPTTPTRRTRVIARTATSRTAPQAQADVPTHDQRPESSERRPRFSRLQIIIGVVVVFLLVDAGLLAFFLNRTTVPSTSPPSDLYRLIQGQIASNRNVSELGSDLTLTFTDYPDLSIVNTSSLKPIEDNVLARGAGPEGTDILYDEQIVKRVLTFNSDWVDYLNFKDTAALASVEEGSAAASKLAELGTGSTVSYHRLALGELRHIGQHYYLIARASYTLTKEGHLDLHDEVFVYKLVAAQDTMLITDFEQISLGVTDVLSKRPAS